MIYPVLCSDVESAFNNNGLGVLSDCASCFVTEEANGPFELSMEYPVDGIHFQEIHNLGLLRAKPNPYANQQLFRIYSITKKTKKICSIKARHISYDLSGIPVLPYSAASAGDAILGLKTHAYGECPFTFWTNIIKAKDFSVKEPISIRSAIGGTSENIVDVFGGELEFDNFDVKLHESRGENRGVSIKYGKNLMDISQEENLGTLYTAVYPYYINSSDGSIIELPEKVVPCGGEYGFTKILTLNVSYEFDSVPTEAQIREYVQQYIQDYAVGVPKISTNLKFAMLSQYDEYKNLAVFERISLFDSVLVEYPELKVSATAKAVKIVYDVLKERIDSVTLGKVKQNISDTISLQQKESDEKATKDQLLSVQQSATAWLTNGRGYAYFRKDENGNIVDILFMDTQDAETATHVMRVGQSGIGFSHDGVNGPYVTAWTIDGAFVADFITAGTISGTRIDGSTLNVSSGATIGAWRVNSSGALTSSAYADGSVSGSVWLEGNRLMYIYSQESGYGILTHWENVIDAGNTIASGLTTSVATGTGSILWFTNGVLTSITQ